MGRASHAVAAAVKPSPARARDARARGKPVDSFGAPWYSDRHRRVRVPQLPVAAVSPTPAAAEEMFMARFRSTKRAKELQRKAKHEAKEARKRERREKASEGGDDDIDWSQAVGIAPPPGTVPEGDEGAEEGEEHHDDALDAANAEDEGESGGAR
jgi:hypothetical protein